MHQTPRIGILADDLTSATDGASPFIGCGHTPLVLRTLGHAVDAHVLAVDAASRNAPDGGAAERAMAAGVSALGRDRLLYKTIDSTLRGWVAQEIGAALAASGRTRVVVAPAFPGAGRTTRHGIQSVHGVPFHESAYGRDPVHPARTSSVPDFVGGLGLPVECIPQDASGTMLAPLGRSGVLILDSDSQPALDRLVALVPNPQEVLWVGSPGLAIALAARFGSAPALLPTSGLASRVLVLAGSANPATRAQCDRLAAAGVPVVRCWSDARKGEAVVCLRAPAERLADTAGVLGVLVDEAVLALRSDAFDAVIATGGETMAALLDRVGADRFELPGDLEPGFPIGRTPASLAPSLTIAMKAGGFGSPDSLLVAARTLVNAQETACV